MMQAELFILRLSRNSGVLGLAGMPFTSQSFSEYPDFSGKEPNAHSILLVRPLLGFSKEDMYNVSLRYLVSGIRTISVVIFSCFLSFEISGELLYLVLQLCQGGNQLWVEDPTNRSPLYARNRIRLSLNNMSCKFLTCASL